MISCCKKIQEPVGHVPRQSTDDILTDYVHGDMTQRLHMYLQYPDLRADFYRIERLAIERAREVRVQGSA